MSYQGKTTGRAAYLGRNARTREDVLRQELQTCRAEMGRFQVIAEVNWQESQALRSHAENWQREKLHFQAEIEQKTAEIERQAEQIRMYQERLSLADGRISSLLEVVSTIQATLTWKLRNVFLRTCKLGLGIARLRKSAR